MKITIGASIMLALASTAFAQPEPEEGDAVDNRFTAERVFDLEYGSDPQISPDGETIVYVRRSMDIEADRVRGALWMIDIDSGSHRPLLDGETAGGSPRWSPDGSRIAFLSSRDGGKPDLKVHLIEADRTYSLAQLQEGTSAPVWSPDGENLAFSMLVPDEPQNLISLPAKPEGAEWAPPIRVFEDLTFRADGQGYLTPGDRQLFVVSADSGTPRQVSRLPGGLSQPAWLGEETLIAVGNDDEERDFQTQVSRLYRVPLNGDAPEAMTPGDGASFSPAVSPNGDRIAFLYQPDEEATYQQTELRVMGVDGSEVRTLTEEYDRSPSSIAWHPNQNAVLALVGDTGMLKLVRFGVGGGTETLTNRIGGEGTGRPYASGSFSVGAGGRIAFTRRTDEFPADIALLTGRGVQKLTDLNGDLGNLEMAGIQKVQVPSSVGDYSIDAWVALPPNHEKDGSAPLLLEIHGGPYAMYGPFFSAEVQRYAAEGYVTVWTNPRGSTGYGAEFAQEIDLAYPGEDYDDLMSVVDYMVDEGWVSEDRLFVTGGSGGGVLTAWIVGNTDRFEAAASIKPVINWTSEALSADLAPYAVFEWLKVFPWEDPDLYWRLSPISKVGNVTTPTLMMAGEEDWRTPPWEAEQFFTALKLQGVDTMLVRVPGASHYIAARPSHLIAKTEAIMAWFDRYDVASANKEEETGNGD
jgi:acylaminoacyl-peptidase